MSLSNMGKSRNLGIKFKKGHKIKLSKSIRKSWIKRKEKYGNKAHPNMILGRIKKLSIPVMQYDKNGVFIKKWNSMKEAQRELKIHNIHNVVSGKKKSCGSFIWKKA